jgi:hypothetical protein
VTFGDHYWLPSHDRAAPLSDGVARLDYSVAKDGKRAAYAYDGELQLSADKFVQV